MTSRSIFWFLPLLIFLLLSGCSTPIPASCPVSVPVAMVAASQIAQDDRLPFRFPLDGISTNYRLFYGQFAVSNECPAGMKDCYQYKEHQYHAAEDYQRPAGTPVYAMADGRISYSGRAGGYGWLILIDHPQANLYSLYGHLSPSRWKLPQGAKVQKSDLIAYLGNPDENGGSPESPLEPHLHFGIRTGQVAYYPSRGEWRYMAGWIRNCPQDLGWLQPSLVITNQKIPPGGFTTIEPGFLVRWGMEILFATIYLIGGVAFLVFAIRKRSRILMLLPGIFESAVGLFFHYNRIMNTYAILMIGILLFVIGICYFFRLAPIRSQKKRNLP